MEATNQCPSCGKDLGALSASQCPFCGADLCAASGPGPEGTSPPWEEQELSLEGLPRSAPQEEPPPPAQPRQPASAEPAPPDKPSRPVGLLAFWCAFAACVAGALAVWALVMAVWRQAGGPAMPQACAAVSFAAGLCAVAIALRRGRPARRVCRHAAGWFGLALCGLLLAPALSGVAGVLGPDLVPGQSLEAQVWALFLTAFAAVVLVLFLREVSWACRAVAVSLACLAALVCLALAQSPSLSAALPRALREGLPGGWVPWAALAASGAALAWRFLAADRQGRRTLRRVTLDLALPVLFLGMLVLCVACTAGQLGWKDAPPVLVFLSAICLAAGLAPVALVGMVAAWRCRGPATDDAEDAAAHAWVFVPGGALLLPCAALAGGHVAAGVSTWLLLAGTASIALIAWLGRQEALHGQEAFRDARPWTATLGAVFAVALAALVLDGATGLRDLYAGRAGAATMLPPALSAAILWTLLVPPTFLVAAGMVLQWRRQLLLERRQDPAAPLRLPCMAGWMASLLLLLFGLVRAGVEPATRRGLDRTAQAAGAAAKDLLTFMAGRDLIERAISTVRPFFEFFGHSGAWGLGLGAALLLCAFALHVLALRGVRGARWLAGLFWLLVVMAGAALACALAGRLFALDNPASYRTAVGRALAQSQVLRFGLFALTLAALLWLWDGVRALLSYDEYGVPIPAAVRPPDVFRRLANFGMVVSAGVLMACFMLAPESWGEAFFFQLHGVVVRRAAALTEFAARAGRSALHWPGHMVALVAALAVLLCVHMGLKQAKVRAFPWAAALWTALMLWVGSGILDLRPLLAWPVQPGAPVLIVASAVLWLVVTCGVLRLWLRWWRQRRRWEDELSEWTGEEPWTTLPAYFGRLGFGLLVVVAALAVLGMLKSSQSARPWLDMLGRGAGRLRFGVAYALELFRVGVEGTTAPGALTWLLALAAGASILLHFASQHGAPELRWTVLSLWSVVALAGVFVLGRMLDFGTLGHWSAAHALGVAALLALTLGLLSATTACWVWMLRGKE